MIDPIGVRSRQRRHAPGSDIRACGSLAETGRIRLAADLGEGPDVNILPAGRQWVLAPRALAGGACAVTIAPSRRAKAMPAGSRAIEICMRLFKRHVSLCGIGAEHCH